jgi:methylmalonyl-CoA mutase N-terminal domain/subunit
MADLFEAIPLDRVSTSMTINSTASILLCLYMAVGERQGVPSERLSGTVQNDILKEYIARGTYVFPPGPSMRLITDMFAFCRERVPRWNTISISGYHLREAGSTAAQEVAFTLANGIAYVTAAREAGLAVDGSAASVSSTRITCSRKSPIPGGPAVGPSRERWRRDCAPDAALHAQPPAACSPPGRRQHAGGGAGPRGAGGCNRSHQLMDEACPLSEAAVRNAPHPGPRPRVGVADVVDPLGGSYHRAGDAARSRRRRPHRQIDGLGGSVHAIPFMQREIQEAAYRYQQDVEAKQRVVVGVNEFVMDEPPPANLFQVDVTQSQAVAERLAVLRRTRDAAAAARALEAVDRAARGRDNLLPPILTAVRAQVRSADLRTQAVFGPPALGGPATATTLEGRSRCAYSCRAGPRQGGDHLRWAPPSAS